MHQFDSNNKKNHPSDSQTNSPVPHTPEPSIASTSDKNNDVKDAGRNKCQYKKPNNLPFWIQAISSVFMVFCTIAIAVITGYYAYYAREQVAQMKEAVNITNEQFKLGQRAWIGITKIDGGPVIGKPTVIDIGLQNTGRTPAINTYSIAYADIIGLNDTPDFSKEMARKGGPVVPNQVCRLMPKANNGTPLDVIDLMKLRDGTKRLFIHGIFKYDDIFGYHHWITFCYFINSDMITYTTYKEHNEIDNN